MLSLLATALLLALHPDSLSATSITVDGAEVWLEMRTQVLSLREVLPSLDVDGDGVVDEAEVSAHRDAIGAYVGAHYRLLTGTDRARAGGATLTPEFMGLLLHPPGIAEAAGYREGAVDLALRFTHDSPVRDLLVECDLFRETSPLHIDTLALTWEGGETYRFGLDARSPWVRVDPEGRGALLALARRSAEHVARSWELLAFLLALVLSARDRRALLLTAFLAIAAGGVGQTLAALDVGHAGPWSGFLRAAGALSMAYLAADVLLQPDARRPRWPEALGFGLVLGLSSGGLQPTSLRLELHPELAVTGWVGASLALQIATVTALGLLAGRLPHRADGDALVPSGTRRWVAVALTVVGVVGFAVRV